MGKTINRADLETIRKIHAAKGLRLDTSSGLNGTIYDANGSATAVVSTLLDECTRSFDKDAEISRLTARVEELERALKPFASFAWSLPDSALPSDPLSVYSGFHPEPRVSDLRKVLTALGTAVKDEAR